MGKFPQIMSKRFQTEVDFRSGKPLEPESSELAAFLDLTRTLPPVRQDACSYASTLAHL